MTDQLFNGEVDNRFLTSGSAVFSFGAARSGKSTLASLAASLSAIDHIDEPFELIHLTASWRMGYFSDLAYVKSSSSLLAEMKCESILMRRCNFRPNDLSSVWKTKGLVEIYTRLFNLKSRADAADYISKRNYKLWVTCTDLPIARNLILKSHPLADSVIVVRDPLEVACAIRGKGWFSDLSLTSPTLNTPVHSFSSSKDGDRYLLPWWLEEYQFDKFVKSDEIGRGLIYWEAINRDLISGKNSIESESFFKYDEIIDNKEATLERLLHLLKRKPTLKTRKILKNIYRRENSVSEVSSQSMRKYKELVEAFQLNK
jgi:hypothetical protein